MPVSDLFARLTRQIIDAIEAGARYFVMPWHRWGRGRCQPLNAVSGRPYRGMNKLILWSAAEDLGYSSGKWATYRQWSESGAQVRKGERSTPILFLKSAADDGRGDDDRDGPSNSRFVSRQYQVFNDAQVDGAKADIIDIILSDVERIAAAEDFICATGANIRHGGDRACYVPGIDQIWLPHFEQFRESQGFYSIVFHELTHWSGAKHRLNRDLEGRFATESYAMEELVAELGAAFLSSSLGLTVEPRPDHAAYIASWLKVLKRDSKAILTASARAQEAADYLTAFGKESWQSAA